MTTVRRTFASTPCRDAEETWSAIVHLLTRGAVNPARVELLAIAGVAASVIADQAPREAPIVVSCKGPQTRIYCVYDDDALDGSEAREDPLGYNPLDGDWAISLPCGSDDLPWVRKALARNGTRVTARDAADGAATTKAEAPADASMVIDPKGFLEP